MGEDCYSKYYVAEKFGGAYKMMNKKRKKRKKEEEGRKKINKKREKNKNASRFFFSFIKILESFEDKCILNLFQPCAI
jgi:hypothetical protein